MLNATRLRRAPARSWVIAALAFAASIAMLWPYRDLVPMWDGWVYTRCVLDAPAVALRCAGHPAVAWSAIMALARFATWPRDNPTFLPGLFFGAVALAGWTRLLRRLLPDSDASRERIALTFIFALHPGILSTVLQPSLDQAILAWGLWMLDGVAAGAMGQSIVFGTLMGFAKETGVILYGVGAATLWWSRLGQRRYVRDALLLAIPVAAFAAGITLPRLLSLTDALPVWGVSATGQLAFLRDFQPLNLWSRHLLNYVLLVTILQFQWIATGAGAFGLLALARTRRLRWELVTPSTPWRRVAVTVCASFAAVTTYRTYSNLRYFAIFLPFAWLGAVMVARRLAVAPRVRLAALAASLACLAVSARWSVDPLSRVVFGTFSIGRERMYDMTRISHECCGHGHDPLAYSFQFTSFSRVLDSAMASLRPGDSLTIARTYWLGWRWLTPLDSTTSMRTVNARHAAYPPIVDAESLAVGSPGPARLWYLEAPFVPDSSASVKRYYRPTGDARVFEASGARIRLVPMQRVP